MNGTDKNFLVEKIRTQYVEKEVTELDGLRALDAKVKRPANVFAYTFGSMGAIIMGAGMSLVMEETVASWLSLGASAAMAIGIAVGIVGLAMTLVNYPIYGKILSSRRKKYAGEIIALSEKIINNK